MSQGAQIDPIWEEKYSAGHAQRYPWDSVVSFLFRHAPRDKPRSEVRVLEVGCGTGSNLWFAAREGFHATGFDGSASAIETARKRFEEEGLAVDVSVGDFTKLPYRDGSFDIVIDRASLTCVSRTDIGQAIDEIARVTAPGGHFLFTPYADIHTSAQSATISADGLASDISEGTLVGFGQLYFASREDIEKFFERNWTIEQMVLKEEREISDKENPSVHAEWRIIARRKD